MRAQVKVTRKAQRAADKGVEGRRHVRTAQPNPRKAGSTWSRRHTQAVPLEVDLMAAPPAQRMIRSPWPLAAGQ